MAKLLLFSKATEEYVVIYENEEEGPPEDFLKPGFTLTATVELGPTVDVSAFPTDRTLAAG